MADEQNPGTEDAGNAEAAKWRRALRAKEAELSVALARVDAGDRREIERLAADRFTDPSDVWAVTSLDAMRADDGALDLEKAEAELGRIEQAKPHWKKQAPEPEPDSRFPAVHQGARQSEQPEPPSFGDQLKNIGRR
jgi:hypothetical protein